MPVGTWLGDSTYDRYWRERMEEAESQLSNYPELTAVFDKLSYPEDEALRNNPLVRELAAVDRGEGNRPALMKVDGALYLVKKRLSSSKSDKLIQELRSTDRRIVMSRLIELICYQYFWSHNLTVTPEPALTDGGECDLRIDDQHPVYVEITRMGNAEITDAIEAVFQAVGQELIDSMPDDTILDIAIDTGQLVWDPTQTKALQQQASQDRILDQFQSAHLDVLLDEFRSISLSDIQSLPNNWTIQQLINTGNLDLINQYTNIGDKLKREVNNPAIQPVLNTPVEEFEGPITHAFLGKANGKLVEVKSNDRYPSGPATEEERVFLNRVETNVRHKIERGQQEPEEANLLLIRASHWVVRGYTQTMYWPWEKDSRAKLQDRIEAVFTETQPENIVGVVLLEENPSESVLIENPFANQQLQEKFSETITASLLS